MVTWTHEEVIDGQSYTFSRPAPDLPYAEVWIARDDGARWVVNTQYALIEGVLDPTAFHGIGGADRAALLPVAEAIVAAARTYQVGARRAAERAAAAAQEAAWAEIEASRTPADILALYAAYGSAEAAWDAGDEAAWARLSVYEPASVAGALPEDMH